MKKLLILSCFLIAAKCNLPNPIPTPGPSASPSPIATPSPVPSPSVPPTPNPTPTAPACLDPIGNPAQVPGASALGQIVDDAVKIVKLENKSMFNGDNLTPWPSDPNNPAGAVLAHVFYQKLQDVLRFAGHCSTLGSDDIGVQVIVGVPSYEWYKLVVYGGGRVRSAAEGYEGIFLYNSIPIPSPTPISSGCPLKVDANHYVKVVISPFGGGNYTESTQLCVNSLPNDMVPPLGHCGNKCCNIGAIDVPDGYKSCDDELFGGPPSWTGNVSFQVDPSQPYNVKVTGGSGTLQACGSKGPCGQINVQ